MGAGGGRARGALAVGARVPWRAPAGAVHAPATSGAALLARAHRAVLARTAVEAGAHVRLEAHAPARACLGADPPRAVGTGVARQAAARPANAVASMGALVGAGRQLTPSAAPALRAPALPVVALPMRSAASGAGPTLASRALVPLLARAHEPVALAAARAHTDRRPRARHLLTTTSRVAVGAVALATRAGASPAAAHAVGNLAVGPLPPDVALAPELSRAAPGVDPQAHPPPRAGGLAARAAAAARREVAQLAAGAGGHGAVWALTPRLADTRAVVAAPGARAPAGAAAPFARGAGEWRFAVAHATYAAAAARAVAQRGRAARKRAGRALPAHVALAPPVGRADPMLRATVGARRTAVAAESAAGPGVPLGAGARGVGLSRRANDGEAFAMARARVGARPPLALRTAVAGQAEAFALHALPLAAAAHAGALRAVVALPARQAGTLAGLRVALAMGPSGAVVRAVLHVARGAAPAECAGARPGRFVARPGAARRTAVGSTEAAAAVVGQRGVYWAEAIVACASTVQTDPVACAIGWARPDRAVGASEARQACAAAAVADAAARACAGTQGLGLLRGLVGAIVRCEAGTERE